MAKKAKVGVETEEAEGKFIKLQLQIRKTQQELQAAAEAGDKVKFNKLKAQLDDLQDSLELTNLKSQQLDDTLAAQPGILGQVGQGIKGLDAQFKVLIANPIVAILAAIVGVFLLLKKSLESTKEGQNALNRVTSAFSAVLGPILATLEKVAVPLFNGLAFVIEKVAKAFSFFAEKLGISAEKIKEATLSVDEVQQKTNEAEKKRQEEATKKLGEEAEKRKQKREKELADAKRINEEFVKNQKATQDEIIEYARQGELANKTDREKALSDEEKKYTELRAKAIKFKLDVTKIDEAYNAKKKAINDKFDADDEKKKQEKAEKDKKLAKDTADALAVNEQAKYQKSLDDATAYYDELIKLNEGNTEKVAELEIAKQQRLDQLKEENRKKEYDKIKGQYQEDENLLIENLQAGLQIQQESRVRDFEGERNYLLEKQAGVNAAFEAEKVAAEGNAEALKDIDKRRTKFNGEIADANKEITKSEQDYKAAAIQQGVATLEQASELLGKDTVAGKATAIAATTIRTYEAAQKAYASLAGIPVVGPALGAIAAAVAVAGGLANVRKILSVQVPQGVSASGGGAAAVAPTGSKFAQGGILIGPSHGDGGIKSPYGELEGGEYVINKRSTKSFMPLLSAINSVGNRRYADGGLTASVSSLQDMLANQPTPIVKTYVVASDMSSQMEADFKIKQLARL
jgi:hypothetical protein